MRKITCRHLKAIHSVFIGRLVRSTVGARPLYVKTEAQLPEKKKKYIVCLLHRPLNFLLRILVFFITIK